MLYYFLALVFIFGLIIGSFLNCLIWRLYKGETILDRSYCPKCRKRIEWYDNIPLLSFILLKGKCRHCREKISWQYPIVEFITGFLFVVAFMKNYQLPITNYQLISNFQYSISGLLTSNFLLLTFRDWFFISVMIMIFVYDLRWYIIPDIVSLPAVGVMFLLNLGFGMSWRNLAISGIICGSFFLVQFLISRGKWLGGGDIRLGFLMGVSLGWPNSLLAIFIGYLIGSVVSLTMIAFKKKKWGDQVPLGIFLTTASVLVLFFGDWILDAYRNLVFIGY
jgi:prepilin signal peptidase PulO-like enzyme (type II secretory pathway)